MTNLDPVVVAVDYSDHAGRALAQAVLLAQAGGARLHVLAVAEAPTALSAIRPTEEDSRTATQSFEHDAQATLEAYVSKNLGALGAEGLAHETHVRFGSPAGEICDYARTVDAHLVVVGTRGRGALKELLLGSVAHGVLKDSPCSVLISR